MDIIIQSLGFTAGEAIETYIREKLQTLKSDGIIRANVTLRTEPELGLEQQNACEILLEVPGNDHFVKRNNQYFEAAVNDCIDLLAQAIKKSKEKQNDRRHADPIEIQNAIIEASQTDIDLEDVVK
ncbi:MAG: HPF/RaiA family ribosome-associated protein [Ferruginibacter sp.]